MDTLTIRRRSILSLTMILRTMSAPVGTAEKHSHITVSIAWS